MQAGLKNRNFLTTSVRAVDAENYRITHVVNTKALDRYMTIVLPKGADVNHYKKNPVVLWLHNMDKSTMAIPIGRCVDLNVDEDEIVCTTEFNPNDPLSMKVFNAYKDGFLNAWSIGFMPKSFEEVTPVNYEEMKAKHNLHKLEITQKQFEDCACYGIWVVNEWELLEYSAVPVPGNPEALSDEEVEKFSRELVTRGIMEDADVRAINFREILKKREEGCKCEDKEKCTCQKPKEEVQPEAKVEDKAVSTVATAEGVKESEVVAEKPEDALRAEILAIKAENDVLKVEVGQITQKNCDLSERMAKLETRMAENEEARKEVETLKAQMVEVKKSVEVDNIETVRQVAQTQAQGANTEGFFGSLLGRK